MKEMLANSNLARGPIGAWIIAILVSFVAGCSSPKAKNPPPSSAKTVAQPTSHAVADESWPTDAYVRLGMPDPSTVWRAADYRDCRDILYNLDRTNRAALPRMNSSKSAPVFARMLNATNALSLNERFLPSAERAQLFEVVLNRLPAFRDVYRFDTRGPIFHREFIELNHLLLRMLRSAVEWDGKALPPGPGEARPVTFRFGELSRTYAESLVGAEPEKSAVPRGDRFFVVGAYAAATMGTLLPWLADGTGLTEEERLSAIRYLGEDMPSLWPQVSSRNQHDLLGVLQEILRRIQHNDTRRELEALRQQLTPQGGRAPD